MIHVPAAVVLGLWFVMQLFSGGMSLATKAGASLFCTYWRVHRWHGLDWIL